MQNQLNTFDFNDHPVRIAFLNEQPWFIAADVCRVLELTNSRMATADLEDDEKGVSITDTLGGKQNLTIISESGLYALIFKSRKAQARKFRKWVTGEVLPALRTQGRYEMEATMQASERGQLAELRRLLLTTAKGVTTHAVSIGQAQAVSLAAQRYLESLKLEGEANGYEKVFGLQNGEGTHGILPKRPADFGLLQDVPQQEVRGTPEDESELPAPAGGGEDALAESQSPTGEGAREGGDRPKPDTLAPE